jgi:hypothetical protein
MVMAFIIHKNSCNSFKCDDVILKTFKYTCDDKSFYFVWNFAQIWKINMKRECLIFFWEKKH